MATRKETIKVDFYNQIKYTPFKIVSGDVGSVVLEIESEQSLIGYNIFCTFKLPDDTFYTQEASIDSEYFASLFLQGGILSQQGDVEVQVGLYDTDYRLTAAMSFYFTVLEDFAETAIENDDRLPILTQLITDVEALEDNVETAEAARVAAEDQRELNEDSRTSNETNRQYYEGLRDQAEGSADPRTGRIGNELDRQDAEDIREGSELLRIDNEDERELNEAERISNEDTRVLNETERIENEEARSVFESYDPLKNYVKGNKVTDGVSAYVALDNSIGEEPSISPLKWLLFARGVDDPASVPLTSYVLDTIGNPIENGDTINEAFGKTQKQINDLDLNKADKNNVLELDNTEIFIPDADYEPATKKYVDDNSGGGTAAEVEYDNTSSELTATNVQDAIDEVNSKVKEYKVDSWAEVQGIVRAGLADTIFKVGDILVADYNGSPINWVIIGINHEDPVDPERSLSLTIQPEKALDNGIAFDFPEATYAYEVTGSPLPAGDYYRNGTNETFTIPEEIPVGGFLSRFSNSGKPDYNKLFYAKEPGGVRTELSIITQTPTIETELVFTRYADAGQGSRFIIGSNRYNTSALRQLLNSSELSFEWRPQTAWDGSPGGDIDYSRAGVLNVIDEELKSVIGPVNKITVVPNADGGGQEKTEESVFLLSKTEVLGTNENGIAEGLQYKYYEDSFNLNKYNQSGSAVDWWLRTPIYNRETNVISISSSGSEISEAAYLDLQYMIPAVAII